MSYSIRLPLCVMIFYLTLLLLIYLNIIPSFSQIYFFLEQLYLDFDLIGLFIASFLEGIAFIGLYFPGSLIIILAVLFSTGTIIEFITIAFVVSFALTLSSILNYIFGRYNILNTFLKPKISSIEQKTHFKKGFFLSFLHPNALGFYFYTLGAQRKSIREIVLVPFVMFAYGFILAVLIYSIKEFVEEQVENPYVMIVAISFWILIALFLNMSNYKTNKLKN